MLGKKPKSVVKLCANCGGQLNPTPTVNLVDADGKRYLYEACPADCSGAVAKDLRTGPRRWAPPLVALLALLLPQLASAQVAPGGGSFVKKSGDNVYGQLRFTGPQTYPIRLGNPSSTARGISFAQNDSAYLRWDGASAFTFAGGNVNSVNNALFGTFIATASNSHPAFSATGNGGFRTVGRAFGSFPACNASDAGAILRDSSTGDYRLCRTGGGSWDYLVYSTAGSTAVTAVTGSAGITSSGGSAPDITCNDAGSAAKGCVTTSDQEFNGVKSFESGITIGDSSLSATSRIVSSIRGTSTVDLASFSDCSTDSALTITVTGALLGAECAPGISGTLPADMTLGCRVVDTDQVKVDACCFAATCDPASRTYSVRVFNGP